MGNICKKDRGTPDNKNETGTAAYLFEFGRSGNRLAGQDRIESAALRGNRVDNGKRSDDRRHKHPRPDLGVVGMGKVQRKIKR